MLKEEIKNMCLNNSELFTMLLEITGKKPNTLVRFLMRNKSLSLRSIEVYNVIKKHTGLSGADIYTEFNITENV